MHRRIRNDSRSLHIGVLLQVAIGAATLITVTKCPRFSQVNPLGAVPGIPGPPTSAAMAWDLCTPTKELLEVTGTHLLTATAPICATGLPPTAHPPRIGCPRSASTPSIFPARICSANISGAWAPEYLVCPCECSANLSN